MFKVKCLFRDSCCCSGQVSVLEGALDCWVFLSCLEVLHRIEGCCDQAQLAANCSHTVGLWAYATDKVTELYVYTGPGQTTDI